MNDELSHQKDANADQAPEVVSAACRFTPAGCHYFVAGPEEFVRSNFKQHLRESHHLGHPVVLDMEICRLTLVGDLPGRPVADAA